MRQRVLGVVVALGLIAAVATTGAAQVLGLPVYNSGIPTGIGLYGNVGFANTDAGVSTVFGAMGRLGLGPLGVTATIARINVRNSDENPIGVGATINYKILGGPLIPLSATLQAGVGTEKFAGIRRTSFPIGLGLALTIPNPVLAIKPWLAPRIDIQHTSVPSVTTPAGFFPGASNTDTHFGISGGVEFNLLSGLGFDADYDWVKAGALRPSTFGLGLHYSFRIPGL